jgi:hypothetical protein
MSQLYEVEGNSIYTFTPGDIVIRTKPVELTEEVVNENLGITVTVKKGFDNFGRIPLQFIGVENNLIYLKKPDIPTCSFKYIYQVCVFKYSQDWVLFVVPEGLTIEDCVRIF